jgi:hypothetical protein
VDAFFAAPRVASEREANVACPGCAGLVHYGDWVNVCPTCGSPHHAACWSRTNQCGSYICAPPRRDLRAHSDAPLLITAHDLDLAYLLPEKPTYRAPVLPIQENTRRTSRLAIASLVCALAGIPLFGVLTGLVAVLLGSLALGGIRQERQRGTGLAVVGVLLGLADVVGWLVFLSVMLSRPGPALTLNQFRPDRAALEDLEPTLKRAMQANVLIETHGGGLLGGVALGSGVIMQAAGGEALILTNRHVVDPNFAADRPDGLSVTVKLIDESVVPGQVIWMAPDGIDLALVRIADRGRQAQTARWQFGRRLRVGEPVFAIGNPHDLGWTHTQGTISQLRLQEAGGRQLRIIQTQTAINPGNSGGGLYDREGYLIGINTWTEDKRVSEGLNFAIALDVLTTLAPLGLHAPGAPGPEVP